MENRQLHNSRHSCSRSIIHRFRKLSLDTARSIGYIWLYSRTGSSLLRHFNNSFEPIMKTTLGRGSRHELTVIATSSFPPILQKKRHDILIRVLLGFTILFFFSLQAHAGSVQIGTTSVDINPSPGYCELDPAQPADAVLLRASPTKNSVLSYSVNCNELADFRAGRRELIDHWARQVTQAALVKAPPEGNPKNYLNELCEKVRATGTSVVSNLEAETKAKIEKNAPSAQYLGSSFQGMIAKDATACYSMTVARIIAQNGVERSIVYLTAFVMIKGRLINHILYAPYVDAETTLTMLAEQRTMIAALEASNP
jgi:hypothetical protein